MFIVEVMAILSARKLNSLVLLLPSRTKPFQLVGVLLFPETLRLIPLPRLDLALESTVGIHQTQCSFCLYLREKNYTFGRMFSLAYSSKVFDFSRGEALTVAEPSMIMTSACGSEFMEVALSSLA